MRHVFIGHGDSDKQASVNPFSKAYDEVWVAGEAGRERYARAQVGVRDENIREVGRPQLGPIALASADGPKQVRRVLYAPTWEGWTNDPYHTSLVLLGPEVVRHLVAHNAEIVVTYKPHPLTGTRDPNATKAHDEIVATLERANRERPDDKQHRIVVAAKPTLYECFNDADLLISDISSVVADFVQSQKPYVVTNPADLDDEEFRLAYPTASASYLLGPDAGAIDDVLDLIDSEDPRAADRRRLKHHLLGADEPDAMTRFASAVAYLVSLGSPQSDEAKREIGFEPEPETDTSADDAIDEAGDRDGPDSRLAIR
jgi:hypothetical protein